MAEFSKLIITEKGKELMAKAVANTAVIKFTKISSSDKAYEFDELNTLETLIGVKQTFSGPSVKRVNVTSVKINAAFHNVELTEGYYLRTIGLHAEDPDTGEILYGVASEMSGNCYMPAYNGITSSGIYLKLVTKVGDTGNVSMEIDPAAVATIGDVEELRNSLEVVDFDDSGEVEGIGSFSDFMSSFVKRTPVYKLLENLKAGLKYVLHTGQLVNNGLCEIPGQFPLDAAYGKTLTDQITGLYSEIADSAWTGTAPDGTEYTLSMFLNELFSIYHPSAKSLITTVSDWAKSVWNRPDAGESYSRSESFAIGSGTLTLSCKSDAGYANHWSAIQITSAAIDLTGYKKLSIVGSEILWGNGSSYYGSNASIVLKKQVDNKETTVWSDSASGYTDTKQASINKEFDVSNYIGKYLIIVVLYANNRATSSISLTKLELTT